MKKYIFLFFLLFLFSFQFSYAQKQGNIWYFGRNAGLDFNSGAPVPLTNGKTYSPDGTPVEGTATISDSSGSLLFYTNGMEIWNKKHQVMPNGDSLLGGFSSTQSSLIVPLPGSSRYFYVFTTDAFYPDTLKYGFRYSIVDICLNGGFGDVIGNTKNVLILDTIAEKLTAVRHSNGIDYWIIVHKYYSDAFYSYQLSSAGILNPVISRVGSRHPNIAAIQDEWAAIGSLKASPDGTRLAIVNGNTTGLYSIAEYFNFDKSTGVVSSATDLQTTTDHQNNYQYYGISFSPDNSKLYITCWLNNNSVLQFNLNAGGGNPDSVRASKVKLSSQFWTWGLQLGTDGKIYVAGQGTKYLGVINNPNNLGMASNFVDSAIFLNYGICSMGLPNFIDSYDYSNTTYNCTNAMPKSLFASSDSSLCAEGSSCIDFFDYSTNSPTSWKWIFVGGIPGASALQNPQNICYPTPGSYAVQLIASNPYGSDTTTYFNIIKVGATPPPFNVIVSGNTLISGSSGSAYQWYFNGSPITGATDSFYVATSYGNYAVQITDGFGCTRLSGGVWASVSELTEGGGIKIYPNPAKDELWVESYPARAGWVGRALLEIRNVLGESVLQSEINPARAGQKSEINISRLAKGIYFVEVGNGDKVYRTKFVKE